MNNENEPPENQEIRPGDCNPLRFLCPYCGQMSVFSVNMPPIFEVVKLNKQNGYI